MCREKSEKMNTGALISPRSFFNQIVACVQIFILMIFDLGLSDAICPNQCSCVSYMTGEATSCGPGLTFIPNNMPGDTLIFSLSALPFQAKNNVPTLSQKDFATITKVKRIQIAFSNVQRIEAKTFAQLTDLRMLDLKGNRLIKISRSIFQGLNNLELLDLTDNVGCQIESGTFDDLSALLTLRLAGIGITNMGNLLSKLNSLKTCDLHGNKLVRLDSGSFAHLSNLRQLDVSFNNLREIQPGMKTILSGLSSFKLDSNPWRCNCAMIWVKTLPAKFIHPSLGGGGGIICDQPAKFQFQDLRNVKDADMLCIPAHVVSCTSGVTVRDGQPANVTCEVVGDPFPDVVWTMPNSNQFTYMLQAGVTSESTISLPSSKFAYHNGDWKIEVDNSNGSDTKTVRIDVITTTTSTTTTSTTTATPTTSTTKKMLTLPAHSKSAQISSMNGITTNSPSGHLAGNQNYLSSRTSKFSTFDQSSSPTTQSTNLPASVNIVLIVAVTAGGVVCLTGFALFSLVIYKTKRKSRIAAKRKSIYSTTGDIEMFSRIPTKITGSFRFQN